MFSRESYKTEACSQDLQWQYHTKKIVIFIRYEKFS